MQQHHGRQTARSEEHKGRVKAEQRRVPELHEDAHEGGKQRCVRVCQLVLIEVVDVGYAEVERGQEDDVLGGDLGEEMQWDEVGAEQELFRYRALFLCIVGSGYGEGARGRGGG